MLVPTRLNEAGEPLNEATVSLLQALGAPKRPKENFSHPLACGLFVVLQQGSYLQPRCRPVDPLCAAFRARQDAKQLVRCRPAAHVLATLAPTKCGACSSSSSSSNTKDVPMIRVEGGKKRRRVVETERPRERGSQRSCVTLKASSDVTES